MAIQIESLGKRYGRVLALDGLSLDVRAGEVRGFPGPDGAGKTTTLWLLMGYLRPIAGSARVQGLDQDMRTVDLARRLDVDLDRPVGELRDGDRQKAGVLLAVLGEEGAGGVR